MVLDLALFGIMWAAKGFAAFNRLADRMEQWEDSFMSRNGVEVRLMEVRDIDRVLEIEHDSFDDPWSFKDFKVHIKSTNHICLVAVMHGRISGYLVYETRKSHLYMRSMAVAPKSRQKGVGRALLDSMAAFAETSNRSGCRLHIPERNLAAQLFLRSCGFKAVNVCRKFFSENTDAYYMIRRVGVPKLTMEKSTA